MNDKRSCVYVETFRAPLNTCRMHQIVCTPVHGSPGQEMFYYFKVGYLKPLTTATSTQLIPWTENQWWACSRSNHCVGKKHESFWQVYSVLTVLWGHTKEIKLARHTALTGFIITEAVTAVHSINCSPSLSCMSVLHFIIYAILQRKHGKQQCKLDMRNTFPRGRENTNPADVRPVPTHFTYF